jgi:hypothetical protein
LQYFCNSDSGIKLGHQKGVDCTFSGVFSELLGGTAKFLGSKMKILLLLEIGSCRYSLLTLKDFISAVSDLRGAFSAVQNLVALFDRFVSHESQG